MAYEPTTWVAGDTVTAAKMNKMEQGIASGGGALVVGATIDGATATLNKTWQEIWDAMNSGIVCVVQSIDTDMIMHDFVKSAYISEEGVEGEEEILYMIDTITPQIYFCSSATDYPDTGGGK